MDQINFGLLLALFIIVVHASANLQVDPLHRLQLNDQTETWDDGDEEETGEGLESLRLGSHGVGKTLVNVDSVGAVGDAITDDTEAFIQAWNIACNTENSVLLVPQRKVYLVKAVRFKGPCAANLIVQIAGGIVAPDEPSNWDPKNPKTWLVFSNLKGVVFQGGGIINGSGYKWWASSCKINKTNPCRPAPTAFTIDSSSAVRVSNLNFKNSQQIHFTISRSETIRVSKVDVQAPGNSPNTDGIHISDSTNVVIQNTRIGTGDDCISIVNGTSSIKMKNIVCGPGHGISIGSLGKDNSTAVVTGVVLDGAVLTETTNGLRIKTWQGGLGYVRGVKFQNVEMTDVENPIIIDQFYCDSSTPCQNQTAAVTVSQIMYINISGTSRTAKAIKFKCSDTVPCSKLFLTNVNLQTDDYSAETFCNSAVGFKNGLVIPKVDCLLDYDRSRNHHITSDRNGEDGHLTHSEL